jgi:hypothetical protein
LNASLITCSPVKVVALRSAVECSVGCANHPCCLSAFWTNSECAFYQWSFKDKFLTFHQDSVLIRKPYEAGESTFSVVHCDLDIDFIIQELLTLKLFLWEMWEYRATTTIGGRGRLSNSASNSA